LVAIATSFTYLCAVHLLGCRAQAAGAQAAGAQAAGASAGGAPIGSAPGASRPSVVKVEKTARGFRLLRNGQPYHIKGVGGTTHLDKLKTTGANSVRTWGIDNLDRVLAGARSNGLTVCAGIWMGHERHGFNYSDAAAVAKQKESVRADVMKYKDDPALLFWAVGNEMEGDGKNPLVWQAVNDMARMIKQIDPNHPTMTVIAELGPGKIDALKKYCPDIDVLGVNAYGGMGSLADRLTEQGWDKPFVVTEYGTLGPWEGGNAPWGAPIEWTSTQKADFAIGNYHRTVESNPDWCLGSYAFLWGNKQERTSTWFGLLLKDGSKLAMVDELTYAWTGQWPANRVPRLVALESEANLKRLPPATRYTANVKAYDPEGDPLQVTWEVRSETTDARGGGDAEQEPPAHPDAIIESKGTTVTFQTPQAEGNYRLFVFVRDGKGGAATANMPFAVGK
jgi:hypothetical protein